MNHRHSVLLLAANEYIGSARALDMALPGSAARYRKLIAVAVKCLLASHQSSRHNQVPPHQEASTCLVLAQLLFAETTNLGRAADILNRGIAVAKRFGLQELKLVLYHLEAQLLQATNPKAASRFLSTCIEEAGRAGSLSWIHLYQMLLASNVQQSDPYQALNILSSISDTPDMDIDQNVLYLSLLLQAMIYLLLLQPQAAISTLQKLDTLPPPPTPNLTAIKLVCHLLALLGNGSTQSAVSKMSELHQFIDNQLIDDQGNWINWLDNGTVILNLNANIYGQNAIVPLKFQWLNQSEFFIFSYLISAVVSMFSIDKRSKANKFIAQGLKVVDSELSSTRLIGSLDKDQDRKVRLRSFKFTLLFYQSYLNLLTSNFNDNVNNNLISELRNLPLNISSKFQWFIPQTLYLTALNFHSTGRTQEAKNHYFKLRNYLHTSNTELRILAALNLLLIIESEIDVLSSIPPNYQQFNHNLILQQIIQERNDLYSELDSLFNLHNGTFTYENETCQLAWKLLSSIYYSNSDIDLRNTLSYLQYHLKNLSIKSPQLTSIILYLCSCQNIDLKNQENLSIAGYINAKKANDLIWTFMNGLRAKQILIQENKMILAQKYSENIDLVENELFEQINPI